MKAAIWLGAALCGVVLASSSLADPAQTTPPPTATTIAPATLQVVSPAEVIAAQQQIAHTIGLLIATMLRVDQNTLSGQWFEYRFGRNGQPRAE